MNKQIVVAVVIITGSGVTNAFLQKKALTPVIIGSYVLLLVLSLVDAYGGPLSTFSGAIALLAATYVLLTEFPWQQVIAFAQGKKA